MSMMGRALMENDVIVRNLWWFVYSISVVCLMSFRPKLSQKYTRLKT